MSGPQEGEADATPEGERARYRIGTVSEMTGVPPETLRAWERRYGAVEPTRTDAGFRMYSEAQVERLLLMKRLSDLGDAVGDVAGLSVDDLRDRLTRSSQIRRRAAVEVVAQGAPSGPAPVVVLEKGVVQQLRETEGDAVRIRVVDTPGSLDDLERGLAADGPRVVVVAGLDRLGDAPVAAARRLLEAPRTIGLVVLYHFLTRKELRRLALTGAYVVRGPVQADLLLRAVLEAPFSAGGWEGASFRAVGEAAAEEDEPNPSRRFDDVQLGRLLETDSEVDCECPNHLAALVRGLLEFEAYAQRCEELSEEDARIHRRLYRETGAARVVLERALEFLCQADGLEV